MNLKQKSRYICIDPDTVYNEEDAVEEMKFENVLDKIGWELNQ